MMSDNSFPSSPLGNGTSSCSGEELPECVSSELSSESRSTSRDAYEGGGENVGGAWVATESSSMACMDLTRRIGDGSCNGDPSRMNGDNWAAFRTRISSGTEQGASHDGHRPLPSFPVTHCAKKKSGSCLYFQQRATDLSQVLFAESPSTASSANRFDCGVEARSLLGWR